jgi:hypothetical protein
MRHVLTTCDNVLSTYFNNNVLVETSPSNSRYAMRVFLLRHMRTCSWFFAYKLRKVGEGTKQAVVSIRDVQKHQSYVISSIA